MSRITFTQAQVDAHETKLLRKGIIINQSEKKPRPLTVKEVQSVNGVCKINIKPISLNHSYTGQRWKTPQHREWRKRVLASLPDMILPATNLKVHYEFGLSTKRSDIDNYIKNLQDLLTEKYHFDDCEIFELSAKKIIVNKGSEYFLFHIQPIS